MASAAPGDATLPPLTVDRLRSAARMIVPVTATDEVKECATDFAGRHRIPTVLAAEVNEIPAVERETGDVLIHSVPDVFGRVRVSPVGWETACVHHRIAASKTPNGCIDPIEIGPELDEDPELVVATIAALYAPLCQQRGVRPVFRSPAPFGLAFIAPSGVELDSDRVVQHRVDLPGLPDLVVVRWAGAAR